MPACVCFKVTHKLLYPKYSASSFLSCSLLMPPPLLTDRALAPAARLSRGTHLVPQQMKSPNGSGSGHLQQSSPILSASSPQSPSTPNPGFKNTKQK